MKRIQARCRRGRRKRGFSREKASDNETVMTDSYVCSGITAWEVQGRRSGCNIARPLTLKCWSSVCSWRFSTGVIEI